MMPYSLSYTTLPLFINNNLCNNTSLPPLLSNDLCNNISLSPFFSGTMMCYGQTGAGKTFTITGATESYKQRGILPRAISQLFKEIEERPEYSITVRYVFRYFLRWWYESVDRICIGDGHFARGMALQFGLIFNKIVIHCNLKLHLIISKKGYGCKWTWLRDYPILPSDTN